MFELCDACTVGLYNAITGQRERAADDVEAAIRAYAEEHATDKGGALRLNPLVLALNLPRATVTANLRRLGYRERRIASKRHWVPLGWERGNLPRASVAERVRNKQRQRERVLAG